MAGDITQPVTLAKFLLPPKFLLPHGVLLRKAHEVVNRLTADEVSSTGIAVSLSNITDIQTLTSQLAKLGVEAIPSRSPEEADNRVAALEAL
jgi:hypothetical protein